MHRTWLGSVVLGAVVGSAAWAAAPVDAQACGGTFCDAGPQSMPVDQSGENILFILDNNEVEVHIQIQYMGDPEQFAWVIPLTAVPDFSIGSEALFENILNSTVPTYGFDTTRDQCGDPNNSNGAGLTGGGDSGTSGADDSGGTEGGGGPTVVLRETVGAYEIAVLQGGTAAEVITWLDDNGYQQDPEAEPILQEYLDEGHLFGAIRLTGGAGVDQIHPIVLRYSSNEPCVPLRLTRIAAVEDMEVRTFFLGNERMVPSNYRHVLVNPLKLEWPSFASNYKEVITAAVDADHANGRAFVTEYAGPSNIVSRGGLRDSRWDPDAFRTLTAEQLPQELTEQGLASCNEWDGCQLAHTLIGGLVTEFLSLPPGVTVEEYLDCPECYTPDAWDPEGFADALAERIVSPGDHAVDLLSTWSYVTRMYTTISPHEMTEDPMFHPRSDLSDVSPGGLADQRILCNSDRLWTLPDGRQVYVPLGDRWPDFSDEMPWEEEVSEIPPTGSGVVLADRTEQIDELLAAYNQSVGFDADRPEDLPGNDNGRRSSCQGCAIEGDDDGWAASLLGLVLGAGVAGRRRRRRKNVQPQ